jgi:hypothetical protein
MSIGALTFPVEAGHLEAASEALISDRHRQQQWSIRRCVSGVGVLVGDAQRERVFEETISRVYRYRDLEDNWDTYGGFRASEQAVRFSVGLLKELQVRPEISPPRVCPISTGVYLEWRLGDRLLYFEVDEDSLLFVMQQGARDREDGEDPDFGIGRAVELVKRLHWADDISGEGVTQHSA